MSDKKILHIISASTLAALVISFLFADSGRIVAAVLMALITAVTIAFIKKRGIPNFVYSMIVFLMAVFAAVYTMIYYLTGLKFGFYITDYGLSVGVFFKYILPIGVIIVATELVRSIMCAQEDRLSIVLSYISSVVAEVLIFYALSEILSFKNFMDIVALVFLPAVISNLLYHYISKRYGPLPNIAYRLIFTLHPYIIPYKSRVPDSLLAFANLLLPLVIYFFIDFVYEKKRRYALRKKSKLAFALLIALFVFMTSLVMLVSNSFRFGAYVIATESMTGELNKGDIAIYKRYDGQKIEEGQVIVFNKNGMKVIHRVADISNIDGQNRYYTKGDANSELDLGYITSSDIVGLVDLKLPYFGYPTLWLRESVGDALKNAN